MEMFARLGFPGKMEWHNAVPGLAREGVRGQAEEPRQFTEDAGEKESNDEEANQPRRGKLLDCVAQIAEAGGDGR